MNCVKWPLAASVNASKHLNTFSTRRRKCCPTRMFRVGQNKGHNHCLHSAAIIAFPVIVHYIKQSDVFNFSVKLT